MRKELYAIVAFLCVFFGAKAGLPDTSKIPATWAKESVIILDYDYEYTYTYPSTYYESPKKEEKIHIFYLIRDKWGVEEMSQLNLPTNIEGSIDENNIGNVYKRDGSVEPIMRSQLIPRQKKIDFNFKRNKAFSFESETDQKLAVPSLEAGDILEVNYTVSNVYAPTFIVLINKFPMLYYKAKVEIKDRDFQKIYPNTKTVKINVMPMNITKEELGYQGGKLVSIELDSVEKFKEEILNNNSRQYPYVLLKYDAPGNRSKSGDELDAYNVFDWKEEEMKKETHLYLARKIYYKRDYESKEIATRIKTALNKKHPVIKDTLTYINDAFYLYRQLIASENIYSGLNEEEYKNDVFFANAMSRVLFDGKINHQIFLTQSGSYSNIPKCFDEFIEPVAGIYIPQMGLYLFNPLYTYEPGNIPDYFEDQQTVRFSGNKYYKYYGRNWEKRPILSFLFLPFTLPTYIVQQVNAKKYRKFDLTFGRVPSSVAQANQIVYNVDVKDVNTNENTVSFERSSSFFGKLKLTETSKICSVAGFYNKTDNPYRKMLMPYISFKPMEEGEKEKKRINHLLETDLRDDGFSVTKVNDFKLIEPNFFDREKPLVHTVNFSAKNLAWTFDNHIVLNAGNFIGEQLIVPESNKNRQQDFYIPYQKQFLCNISIPVPEGYKVENLKEFNVKKVTPAGSFTAEAVLESNKVIIRTKKTYGFHFYPREDADDVYGFLYEAEKYYNKKMIFTRQ